MPQRAEKLASVVFVANDFAAWLTGLLADAGRKKLTTLVFGSDQARALQQAATAAVKLTAEDMRPESTERAEELAVVVSEVFRAPVPEASMSGQATVLEALQAGIARQLGPLDDPGGTGTGQSSAEVLGVSAGVLADKLTGYLVGEIVVRGARGGPLVPLASQLNHDLARQQGLQLTAPGRDLAVLAAPHREDLVLPDLRPVINVAAEYLHDPSQINAIVSLSGLIGVRLPTGRLTSRNHWTAVFEAALEKSPETLSLLFSNIRDTLPTRSRSVLDEALREATVSQVSRMVRSYSA